MQFPKFNLGVTPADQSYFILGDIFENIFEDTFNGFCTKICDIAAILEYKYCFASRMIYSDHNYDCELVKNTTINLPCVNKLLL